IVLEILIEFIFKLIKVHITKHYKATVFNTRTLLSKQFLVDNLAVILYNIQIVRMIEQNKKRQSLLCQFLSVLKRYLSNQWDTLVLGPNMDFIEDLQIAFEYFALVIGSCCAWIMRNHVLLIRTHRT